MSFFSIIRKWFSEDDSTGRNWFSGDKSADGKPLFDGDIKEVAVRLALAGKGLEDEQQKIENYYINKELPLKQKLEGEKEYYDEQIKQVKAELDAQKKVKTDNDPEIYRLEVEQQISQELLIDARSDNNDAWHKILSHRFQKGKEFFDAQHDKIISNLSEDLEQIKATLLQQFDIERAVHNVRLENYEINKDEMERQAVKCEESLAKIENQLEKSRGQADALKKWGITRLTSWFLLVAGVVSLAGAGTVVSNLLQDRSPGDDLITWIVKSFGDFFKTLYEPFPSWAMPLVALSAIFIFLGLFYMVIVISNRLVKRFDKTWDPESDSDSDSSDSNSSKPKASKTKRVADSTKTADNKTKSPFFNLEALIGNSQGIKSYFDFISPNIERKDYSRLIASFPYIFLIAILIFLLSANKNQSSFTLSTAYIGIIVVLLTTSCCVIYITKVIEPRWQNYLERKNNPNTPTESKLSFILLNKEILFLVILLMFSLILASVLPVSSFSEFWKTSEGWVFSKSAFQHVVWGSLAIFVTLSSLGLAYGIVYQGFYQELDYLSQKSHRLRIFIGNCKLKPIIGNPSIFESNDFLTNNINKLQLLEDNKVRYETAEIFGNDMENYEFDTSSSSNPVNVIGNIFKQVFSSDKPKASVKRELRLTDYNHDAEAAKDFLNSRTRVISIGKDITANQDKIVRLKSEITSAAEKQKEAEKRYVDLLKLRTDAINEVLKRINELKEEKEKDLLVFTAAYTVGSVANRLLRDEDILASEIINVQHSTKPGEFSTHALNSVFPLEAFWKRNNSLVTVTSYQGMIDNRHSYKIDKNEIPVPEDELLFINRNN